MTRVLPIFADVPLGHPALPAVPPFIILGMVSAMDEEGFGSCTNQYECSAVCPKSISHDFIARMNRDYLTATLRSTFSQAPASVSEGAG